ncbi:MAG TPA: ATP-binding protein [Burkholderiaceae bacterium]|nr:ATP-binding protein [Burkholderiaceae bacterium]
MTDDPPASTPAESPASSGVLNAAARNDRRLFDSLNEGVWERDLKTGEVWYSPRYKSLLGFEDHELPNLVDAVRERLHPDDLAGARAAFARAAQTPGQGGEGLARLRVKDGSYRWFRGRFTVWPDAQGQPGVLVGALHDVQDQIAATEALKAQQAVLEQRVRERTQGLEAALQQAEAQRLAAERANRTKASFLAHMSHELRTPLNGVLGMTQLAQALALGAEQRRYLELAQQSGQALLGFLDDVLDFAQAEAGRLQLREEAIDLAALAAETLRSFMPALRRKGLQVGFDYVGDITRVRADAGRVRQIIANLLGNAIKYTEAGGILLVVAVEADAQAGHCRVRLRVRDSGVGMDEATVARVFEPFEQGDSGIDRRHGGSGLGLSVVQMLARLMGGEVSVRSRPGRGSEFRIELRLAAEPDQPLRTRAAAATAGGHAWVLVRDPIHGDGICQRLARIGWSAEVLPDVAAAILRLRAAPAGGTAPECVLIGEDALGDDTDLAQLRHGLRPGVPVTLLLHPDFDLGTVHAATERLQLRIAIAPLAPADVHALVQRDAAPQPVADLAQMPAPRGAKDRQASVLIVEDNPMNQIIAREMVAALGLRPAVVCSGEEAMLSCRSTPPDLVLMDIQMPGMDGLETTRRLRALQAAGELRRFPIIALTAHATASDRAASLAAGMDEHLTKPVQLEQLRRVLWQWLAAEQG